MSSPPRASSTSTPPPACCRERSAGICFFFPSYDEGAINRMNIQYIRSIESTYDRHQQFGGAGRNLNEGNAISENNQDKDPSNLQSRLGDIACWSLQKNADEADANMLQKLEKLLKDALRSTKSKKMLAKQKRSARTGASGVNSNGLGKRREEGLEQSNVRASGTRKNSSPDAASKVPEEVMEKFSKRPRLGDLLRLL